MLTRDQREEFARTGLLRVAGVLDESDAARVRADIWAYLTTEYGIHPDDRTTWPAIRIPTFKGLRRSEAFDRIGEGPVPAALDDLMGPRWGLPKEWARNPMVTFPMPGTTWDVPADGWHFDKPFEPDGLSMAPGINVFVFADTVRPRGAGTVVLSGSHRLVARYSAMHKGTPHEGTLHARELKHALVADHPWFRALYDPEERTNRIQRFMVEGTEIDGVELRVVELTGEPGDGILMDARTLHTVAPNCLDTPRMMLNQMVSR